MADENFSIERAVWTAMQSQRPMTLDELQMITGREAGECAVYLNVLIRHQYASVLGIRRAGSGEALPMFRLTRATGPEAPYGNAEDSFYDPNLDEQPGQSRKRLPMPTMVGKIRVAGQAMGLVFTRDAMRVAVGGGRPFQVAWNRLKHNQELLEAGLDDAGRLLFRLVFKNDTTPIREFFLANLGRLILGSELKRAVGAYHGAIIYQALDMLACQGYRVTIVHRKTSDWAKYQVDAPEGKE